MRERAEKQLPADWHRFSNQGENSKKVVYSE
jgi:hypothetical protein